MTWRLNPALSDFRAAVNTRYPLRDKTSDGTVGDLAHQATNSDHNPDPDGSVDAWDMDVDLRSGDDPAAIEMLKRVFQAHVSSRYWIHNRRIASRSDGWVRRYYDGSNPHDKHVHWNTRESYENSAAPWLLGEDDDMQLTDPIHFVTGQDVAYSSPSTTVEGMLAGTHYYVLQTRNRMEAGQRAILAAVQGLDTDAVIAAVNARADEDARRDAELLDLVRQAETGGATAAEIAALVAANLAARLQS